MQTDESRCASPEDREILAQQAGEVTRVLEAHPAVREAAVLPIETGGWQGFIVANDEYLDEVLNRKSVQTLALNKWRKSFDLTQFTEGAASKPIGFNTQGWNSSYTGKEQPASDMHEWIQSTVSDILQLKGRRIYEIGCGTGMLLMRLAPSCDRYVAVDFSPATLEKLRAQLKLIPELESLVEVIERKADDFEGIDSNTFDVVVINSIAQFFPSLAYLTQVLKGAINSVRSGGHVFVGDILSLPLLPLFASSVELFLAKDELTAADLLSRIHDRATLAPYLFVPPAFFLSLRTQFPRLSRVEIRPRVGRADNEMTRYRYNAILHVGDSPESLDDLDFLDWREDELTLERIRARLREHQTPFGISHIRNERVGKDLIGYELLRRSPQTCTAEELRRCCSETALPALHPQDLLDLSNENLGFKVQLSWAASRSDGSYDAAFIPESPMEGASSMRVRWPQPELSEFVNLASWPGQRKIKSDLLDSISIHCRQHLPPALVLSEIRLTDMLPRDTDGTIDTNALLNSASS